MQLQEREGSCGELGEMKAIFRQSRDCLNCCGIEPESCIVVVVVVVVFVVNINMKVVYREF
jgi:hypothetical protein